MQFVFLCKNSNQLETVNLKLTGVGWYMEHDCYRGNVNPDGRPYLQQCITKYSGDYPSALGDAFQEIWEAAIQNHLTEPEIQSSLDEFSEWVLNYTLHHAAQLSPGHRLLKERGGSPA